MLCAACKTPPPVIEDTETAPGLRLVYERIEGSGINQVVLYYHFKAENPRSASMNLNIQNWSILINGFEIDHHFAVLKNNNAAFSGLSTTLAVGKTYETDFELHLDLDAIINAIRVLSDKGITQADDSDTFVVELVLDVSCQYGTEPPISGHARATSEFPRIREPEFSIRSIAILQAELINTRFAVTLRIDNPNPFPVTLSSFKYELYGHGMYWAEGREQDILVIPAKNSAETKLFLMMNFINMKRKLLDEIIAMREVSYRFTGSAEVETGISWLPRFSMKFDKKGLSEVLK